MQPTKSFITKKNGSYTFNFYFQKKKRIGKPKFFFLLFSTLSNSFVVILKNETNLLLVLPLANIPNKSQDCILSQTKCQMSQLTF